MKNNAQHINQDSENFEYYTPKSIVGCARNVMGGIDLDPATSKLAMKMTGIDKGFSSDGLIRKWKGNIFMNHPFSRTNNPLWINKLVDEYENGEVDQACCITYASTSEKWFQPLFKYPMCFLSPRTNYYLPNGEIKKGVTKGSVVTYLGEYVYAFDRYFSGLGNVVIPFCFSSDSYGD